MQHQILLDSQGKQNILALGEIYKVVKLIGLSAKVYKPFVLPNVSNFPQFLGVLDECDALWSKLGLEEAIKRLSNNVDFGRSETAEALITSIRNILDIDTVAVHNCVFIQHKSICQLSLLPEEMLADLKTVLWGEKAYFLNLANLWANLISCDPPQLPHLQVS
ncbi:Helicase SWR1 [Bienertia sinuspersici]